MEITGKNRPTPILNVRTLSYIDYDYEVGIGGQVLLQKLKLSKAKADTRHHKTSHGIVSHKFIKRVQFRFNIPVPNWID